MKQRSAIGISVLLGLSLSVLGFGERADARGRPKPPPGPKISEVVLNGKIDSMQANGLMIKAGKTSKSKDQTQWLVAAGANTEVTIHGTATLDFVRKGQIVEFSAEIVSKESAADKSKKEEKTAEPVTELTILAGKRASAQKKVAAKDHAADAGVGGGRIETAKAETDVDMTVAADDPKTTAGTGKKTASKPQSAAIAGSKTKIVGRVDSVDTGSVTVTAGERTIHVDLADIPTIKVEISDPKIVPNKTDISKTRIEGTGAGGHTVSLMASDLAGAKIIVRGTASELNSDRECAAKSIQVTLANPLSGKTSTSSTSSSSAAKKTPTDK